MTQIVGTLKSSTGVAISCTIRATLDQRVIDETTSPDTLYTPVSGTFTVTGGVINFTLPESQTSGVTYLFEYLDTVTLEPYPGLDSFRAIVPNLATVEWTDLQASGLATDVIDTSIAGVVRKLLVSPNFWQAAQDYIFPYRGEWSNLSFYERGDVVSFNGSTYHYTHNISLAGEVPDTSPYWRLWAQKGDTGTGTAGNDTAYDPIAWDGQTDAPSRNAVRDIIEQLPRSSNDVYGVSWDGSLTVPTRNAIYDIIETLARKSQLSSYALLNSPTFTGNPGRDTDPTAGDRTGNLATTRWVGTEFATKNNAELTGNPTAPTPAAGDNDTSIATTAFVQARIASGQIPFPAVQVPSSDVNTLDDYEEGTWTPSLTFGGGFSGLSYAARGGRYIKIGRLVYIFFRVALTAKGTSVGNADILGLPFNGAVENAYPSLSVAVIPMIQNITVTYPMLGQVNSANNQLQLWNNTLSARVTDANFANDSRFGGNFVYEATQ